MENTGNRTNFPFSIFTVLHVLRCEASEKHKIEVVSDCTFVRRLYVRVSEYVRIWDIGKAQNRSIVHLYARLGIWDIRKVQNQNGVHVYVHLGMWGIRKALNRSDVRLYVRIQMWDIQKAQNQNGVHLYVRLGMWGIQKAQNRSGVELYVCLFEYVKEWVSVLICDSYNSRENGRKKLNPF